MVDSERLKGLSLAALSLEEQAFLQVGLLTTSQPDQFAVIKLEDGDFGLYLSLITDLLPSQIQLFIALHSFVGTSQQDFHLFNGIPNSETRLYYQGAWGGVDAINRYNELRQRLPNDPLKEVTFNLTGSPVFLETRNYDAESKIKTGEALAILQNSTCRIPQDRAFNTTLADVLHQSRDKGSVRRLPLLS